MGPLFQSKHIGSSLIHFILVGKGFCVGEYVGKVGWFVGLMDGNAVPWNW